MGQAGLSLAYHTKPKMNLRMVKIDHNEDDLVPHSEAAYSTPTPILDVGPTFYPSIKPPSRTSSFREVDLSKMHPLTDIGYTGSREKLDTVMSCRTLVFSYHRARITTSAEPPVPAYH